MRATALTFQDCIDRYRPLRMQLLNLWKSMQSVIASIAFIKGSACISINILVGQAWML